MSTGIQENLGCGVCAVEAPGPKRKQLNGRGWLEAYFWLVIICMSVGLHCELFTSPMFTLEGRTECKLG